MASDSARSDSQTKPLPLVWRIDPLPDFLADHTLLGEEPSHRIRDVISRWVQLLSGLWGWHDRATFALRYLAFQGRIDVFFMADAHNEVEQSLLSQEVSVLLRAHRLVRDGAAVSRDEAIRCLSRHTLPDFAVAEVKQLETCSLWQLPQSVQHSERLARDFGWLPKSEIENPRVVYPWWAPGGPFLLPMESLISQPVPVSLTVYLEPTLLTSQEWSWLAFMAQEAQSKGEQNLQQLGSGASIRAVDPSASLAGRLYIANLRRLSAAPFLVAVHCAAAEQRLDVVRCLAGAMQALVQEPPFDRPDQDEERLPSSSQVRMSGVDVGLSIDSFARQYQRLRFSYVSGRRPLDRIGYLADARGAATAFRLPISVRGGVPGIEVRQSSPDFHPGPRRTTAPNDHIKLGEFLTGGCASMPLSDLTKHALVCGFTGSGKTVTVLYLLHQICVEHRVPFLVLESAKQEYRGLCGVSGFADTLRVYTVGNENGVPLRLNPFELLSGVRVEAHLSKLQTCFEAAIPPLGPSSSVISEALLRVYALHGWQLTDIYPAMGRSKRRFPILSEFVDEIERVLADRGYEGEVNSNLRAALVGRFKPLLMGSKGRMFDTQRSSPTPEQLFSLPTILELNDLSLDDKALVVMFILTLLREYREKRPSKAGELVHVTVVEEAHNVLENVASKGSGEGATSADTRHKAVEAFCSLLTEIRALGEGLIIADQSPEKLAKDALRNTNLQIAHQLRDGDDRDVIAKAMIMEVEQRDYIGKLRPGNAALFRTGLEKATFVQFPKYYPTSEDYAANETDESANTGLRQRFPGYGFDKHLSDEAVRKRMHHLDNEWSNAANGHLPYTECQFCGSPCSYRDAVYPIAGYQECDDEGNDWFDLTTIEHREELGVEFDEMWSRLIKICVKGATNSGVPSPDRDAAWCYAIHLWNRETQRRGLLDQSLDHECFELFATHFEKSKA